MYYERIHTYIQVGSITRQMILRVLYLLIHWKGEGRAWQLTTEGSL